MKVVSLVSNVIQKARRNQSQAVSIQDADVKDPIKLAETLRQVMLRVNKLEALTPPEATEFEVVVSDSGALTELYHKVNGPVRWTVVGWYCVNGQASPVSAPKLVFDPSSTPNSLFLRSYTKGRAIIRVEPSQTYVDPGATIDVSPSPPVAPLSAKATYSSTATQDLLAIPIPDNSVVVYRVTCIGQSTTTLATRCIIVYYLQARRQGAGPIDVITAAAMSNATAGTAVTANVVGNTVVNRVQNTTVGNTTIWTCNAEPLNYYLRDEP